LSEFFDVVTPEEAINMLLSENNFPKMISEKINTIDSNGRILTQDIKSEINLPHFNRSSMDGYAIDANDSNGVSLSNPNYLEIIEEIKMGDVPKQKIIPGKTSRIFTGGMMPEGSTAVIMEEDTEELGNNMIEIKKPVSTGENIIFIGEETKKGNIIIKKGIKIRSQEIGSLLESGLTKIFVSKRPIIGVLSSGDELIPPGNKLELGKIRDINTYTISNLIKNSGCIAKIFPILPDDLNSQLNQAKNALQFCDMLIFSAGSSISYRDTTAEVINSLEKPGVIVHGISVKPGKPTILGLSGTKPIIGLPGNPVSSIMIFINIVKPILDKLNNHVSNIGNQIDCTLTQDISSQTGREDYVQVSLKINDQKILATPVFGKSNLINTLVNSDGFITIPPETGGLYKNSLVKVKTYE
tara:strand:+ start:4355 stop:5590 length:1236 start_codon:yes stop_codon:yes gene_type:complete